MRKMISLFACCCSMLLASAQVEKNMDKEKTRIEGSGNVVTRDVPVQAFDQLEASGVFNVMLTQGDRESLKIEAEDNLQDLFIVKNESSKLVVSMKKDPQFDSKKKMTVYITFRNLKSMDLKMVGNLSSSGNLNFGDLSLENKSVGSVEMALSAQKLDIRNKSVGNLKLSGKAQDCVIKNNSVGAIKAGDLVVQTMDIDNDGIGSAEVNAAREIRVKDSFLGKVKNVSNTNARRIQKVVI